jgi:dimeric dUTPase (all-alpha-NTP-PPase superfamily)
MNDMLNKLFMMQRDLNAYVGAKHGIKPLQNPDSCTEEERIEWINNFTKALRKEAEELEDCEDWKWWHSINEPYDWHNAKIEVIDLWHFLISITIMAGMTPEDLFKVYEQKWQINFNRQDNGYSKATKTEDDNKSIEV